MLRKTKLDTQLSEENLEYICTKSNCSIKDTSVQVTIAAKREQWKYILFKRFKKCRGTNWMLHLYKHVIET